MKNLIFVLLFSIKSFAAQPKEVVIGFIPNGDKQQIKSATLLIAKEVQKALGVPVTIFVSKSYSSLITAMKNKKVDFAFFTAHSLVAAENEIPLQVLLKKVWQEPFYYSVLLSSKTSKISSIKDIKNKRVVFVDKKSTSGFLYPMVMLKKNGINESSFSQVIFSGGHDKSIELMEKNEADVAAVFSDDKDGIQSAWAKYGKKPNSYKKIWVSEPIPNDPFCVRKDFYDVNPKIVHNMMIALIDAYDRLKNDKNVSAVFGAHSFMPATSRQYDPVREMVKFLGSEVQAQ